MTNHLELPKITRDSSSITSQLIHKNNIESSRTLSRTTNTLQKTSKLPSLPLKKRINKSLLGKRLAFLRLQMEIIKLVDLDKRFGTTLRIPKVTPAPPSSPINFGQTNR